MTVGQKGENLGLTPPNPRTVMYPTQVQDKVKALARGVEATGMKLRSVNRSSGRTRNKALGEEEDEDDENDEEEEVELPTTYQRCKRKNGQSVLYLTQTKLILFRRMEPLTCPPAPLLYFVLDPVWCLTPFNLRPGCTNQAVITLMWSSDASHASPRI